MSAALDPRSWVRRLRNWGSDDPAFDVLMAAGPLVVLVLVVAGRNAVTTVLAAVYVAGFVAALGRNVLRSDDVASLGEDEGSSGGNDEAS